ncbi:MAG: S-layer homology domain-containing protein [Faecalibacterium sp.]
MKKRFLSFLLAVSIAVSLLALPASAVGQNAAVQTAAALGGLTGAQTTELSAVLTRGQLAQMLTAFSSYRESAAAQGSVGTLFSDVDASTAFAGSIRIAVQQGWMSGYSDGSFRPEKAVTLEEACTALLNLLGYDVTTLKGTFPAAQLNKASELGLRTDIGRSQGESLTLADGAQMFYNALAAKNSQGTVYGQSLGFTVSNGQVDISTILLANRKGPFVADETTTLPFVPATVYYNDTVSSSAQLSKYDVYYYSENLNTVWIYSRRAAGRITALSPSASAPTKVTVAGTEYTVATTAAAAQLSSLNGGGIGQVVTLLLGLNNEVVAVLTGDQADEVFYGVVQTATRSLELSNGADVKQTVTVACTDGVTRSVNVDKSLNYPAGWLVEIRVDKNGESIRSLETKSIAGTVSEDGTALGDMEFASGVEILDTTSEGLAGTIRPSRLSGVTLLWNNVKYYTTNEQGQIDRLILDNVTGDLMTYAVLDDVKNLIDKAVEEYESSTSSSTSSTGTTASGTGTAGSTTGSGSTAGTGGTSGTTGSTAGTGTAGTGTAGTGTAGTATETDSDSTKTTDLSTVVSDVADIVLPSTSDILYGILDGSISSTLWESLSSNTDKLTSYALQLAADNTSGTLSSVFNYLASGATYKCYVNGQQTTFQTSTKYPVVAGGIAISKSATGKVKGMVQLMPVLIDRLGAASAMSGSTRYETADDMQVYLWYKGQYYAVSLADINAQDYSLIGWYDAMGCTAGGKIRILVAVKKS